MHTTTSRNGTSRNGCAKLLLVTTALPLLTPLAGFANSATAMDACVKAFIASSIAREQPVTVQKEEPDSDSVLASQSRAPYRIALTARGRSDGKHLARATCTANRDGEVITLDGVRVQTPRLVYANAALDKR